ncbi:MAG: proton-conducting transporter membrane subunit [Candidatus Marinimicrobia bacterium]|nr:proton-conducting transporter membrane subunit [Candidatus Neomarinimicrobiota bacterium]
MELYFSPVHFIAVPLFAAFLLPLLGRISQKLVPIVPGIVLLYLSVVALTLFPHAYEAPIVEIIAGWRPPFGITLIFGPLAAFLVTMITLIGFVVWIYSYRFIIRQPLEKYYMLFMLLIAGSTGIILTGDIFNLFVFLEITAIAAYALTAFLRDHNGAEAAFKYLLIGSFTSAFVLLAIIILYANVGTLNMADIAMRMSDVPVKIKLTIMILFIVGLGIEAELFPLNGWAPDAYSQAPSPIGALFAGIVVKAAVYALMRVLFTLFDLSISSNFLIVMGTITLLIAEMSAMRQQQIKRMLAFSSIGQMGLVLVAFGLGTKEGIAAALFLMFSHAVIKSMLFFSAGYLVFFSGHKNIVDLEGMGREKPWTGFFFSLGALAIIGLPPFSGFWGKFYLLISAANSDHMLLIVLILFSAVIEAVYYLRVVGRLYFKKLHDIEVRKTPFTGLLAMGILAFVTLTIGIYPDFIHELVLPAANELLDKAAYLQYAMMGQ